MQTKQIPDRPILTNSVLVVKSTAALSEKVMQEIAEGKEEKNIEELLDEKNRGDD